jgi:DNA-binding CsgD family transcriptional regulator
MAAGRSAKASSSFEAASRYYRTAVDRISEEDWSSIFDLCFELSLDYAECLYFSGSSSSSEKLLDQLLLRARNRLERVRIHRVQITQYVNKGKYAEAVTLGLQSLQEFNILIPRYPGAGAVMKARAAAKKLAAADISHLIALPQATNPDVCAAIDTMMLFAFPALLADKDVYAMMLGKFLNLSLKYGNTPASLVIYGTYGLQLCNELEHYEAGLRLLKAAYALSETASHPSMQGKLSYMLGKALCQWEDAGEANTALLIQAVRQCLDAGDFVYAGLAMTDHANSEFMRGKLEQLYRLAQSYLLTMLETKNSFRLMAFCNYMQLVSDYQGLTSDFTTLEMERLNHNSVHGRMNGKEYGPIQFFRNYTYRTQMHYILGNYPEAIMAAEAALPHIQRARLIPHLQEHHFYYALSICAAWDTFADDDKPARRTSLKHLHGQMKQWAAVSPANFMHKYELISAEMARLAGNESKAIGLYHKSVLSAREGGYMQCEAIANELFAKFYLSKGIDKVARVYMTDAYEGFMEWGAIVKARMMLDRYPGLAPKELTVNDPREREPGLSPPDPKSSDELNLSSVLKAAQSFLEEADLEQLLFKLTHIIIENTGAEKGCLLVERGDQLHLEIVVLPAAGEPPSLESVPLEQYPYLAGDVVRYSASTLTNVKLDHAELDERFREDRYIREQRTKSIVCIPVTKPGHPKLLLYLENNTSANAFALIREDVLQLLAFQMYYVRTMLQSIEKTVMPAQAKGSKSAPALVDPLTARELEVLKLMAKGLSNQEIGEQIDIVVGTVKNHIKNIFGKLGVSKRMKAVAQAKEWKLIH